MKISRSMAKEKLQKIVLIGVVSVAGVIAVSHFYVLPQLKVLSASKEEIAKLRSQVRDAENTAKQAAQNTRLREKLQAFVDEQQTTMVSGDPYLWVVLRIRALAEHHPVRVLGLRPGGKLQHERLSRYQTYTATIDVTGAYDQLGEFLRDLESTFPSGEIRSLDISGDPAGQQHRMGVVLALLVQPEIEK